jgi:hypothetical protein
MVSRRLGRLRNKPADRNLPASTTALMIQRPGRRQGRRCHATMPALLFKKNSRLCAIYTRTAYNAAHSKEKPMKKTIYFIFAVLLMFALVAPAQVPVSAAPDAAKSPAPYFSISSVRTTVNGTSVSLKITGRVYYKCDKGVTVSAKSTYDKQKKSVFAYPTGKNNAGCSSKSISTSRAFTITVTQKGLVRGWNKYTVFGDVASKTGGFNVK